MNLDVIPVIDTHAHPFPSDQRAVPWSTLRDALSEAARGPTTDHNDSSLLVRMLVRRLSRLLHTPAEPEILIAVRNELAQGPAAYHARLWSDANIAAVLIDPGFPVDRIKPADFSAGMPCPVYEGYRIEQFGKGPIQTIPFDYDAYGSFATLVDAFRDRLDGEAAKPGFRFFKSIIAYRTGLSLTVPTEADVMSAWKERPEYRSRGEKLLRDFLFHQAALKALEHNGAFQVHTGHTAHDQPWSNANPIEMTLFLNEPRMDEVRFVQVPWWVPLQHRGWLHHIGVPECVPRSVVDDPMVFHRDRPTHRSHARVGPHEQADVWLRRDHGAGDVLDQCPPGSRSAGKGP